MSIEEWGTLQCQSCFQEKFHVVIRIQSHPSLGTSQKPAGMRCDNQKCRKLTTIAELAHHARIQQKLKEVQAVSSELRTLTASCSPLNTLDGNLGEEPLNSLNGERGRSSPTTGSTSTKNE